MLKLAVTTVVFLLLITPLSSWADDDNATPPVQTSGSVSYMTGGVGAEEREALFAATKDYGLKLVFAVKEETAFLSDVTVSISADNGKPMMKATDTGPYLFAKLPPGKYKITATSHEQALEKSASVSAGKQADAAFYW